jgi:hypothetical protein
VCLASGVLRRVQKELPAVFDIIRPATRAAERICMHKSFNGIESIVTFLRLISPSHNGQVLYVVPLCIMCFLECEFNIHTPLCVHLCEAFLYCFTMDSNL